MADSWMAGETGRDAAHDSGHEDHPGDQDHQLRKHLPGEDAVSEQSRCPILAFGVQSRVARQECRIDPAFAEDGAEIARKEKGDDEGIGH